MLTIKLTLIDRKCSRPCLFLLFFSFCLSCYITGICWTEPLTNIEYLRAKKRMTLNVLESTKRSLLSFKFRALSNLFFMSR